MIMDTLTQDVSNSQLGVVAFEFAPLPMLVVDRQSTVRELNRAAAARANRSAAEGLNRCSGDNLECLNQFHRGSGCGIRLGCEHCTIRDLAKKCFQSGRPQTRLLGRRPNTAGTPVSEISYLAKTMLFDDAEGSFVLVCLEDITERELALRKSQERLALVIEGTNAGVWDWNVQTNEVYFSPRWKGLLGYAEDEIENNFTSWEQLMHPEDRSHALSTVQECVDGSTKFELEHRLRHKDGSYRWMLARGMVLRDAQGHPTRVAGSQVDVTERKHAVEELRQAYAALGAQESQLRNALAELNTAYAALNTAHAELKATQLQLIQAERMDLIGKMAAGIAHEVKNPLQTLLMGLSYLKKRCTEPDAALQQVFQDLFEAVSRADGIVRGLLEMAGERNMALAEQDLNTLVERALHLVQFNLNASRVSPVRQLAPDLPRLLLDRTKMEQVFLNLFTNAIHAMPKGGTLKITTSLRSQPPFAPAASAADQSGTWVVTEIQDTGVGIPEQNLPKLFTPFFTTKPKGEGTGLGLRVSRSIVEMHGGSLQIQNAPEGGVRVTILLRPPSLHACDMTSTPASMISQGSVG